MKHKYLIMVGDGMADFPIDELGGKTPLEYASTPNMDSVASMGRVGLLATIPNGYLPGSDVGNLSLLGYDPTKYFSGRAPIEAASMGVKLAADDVAFRCNLVTVDNGVMMDYSAGHISTPAAAKIIGTLQKAFGNDEIKSHDIDCRGGACPRLPFGNGEIKFHPGVSYRHLLTIKNTGAKLECTPPHDITGQRIDEHLPKGSSGNDGREYILSIMDKAREIIANMGPENESAATDIWLWGQGPAVTLPTFQERYGLSGSVISAVDLVRGLGKLAGLTIRIVDGATGYLGTNYAGKVAAAKSAFENGEDFVFLHVEAPDETSHEGVLNKKIQAIEEFDRHVVGEMLKYQSANKNLRIAVTPDHVTALSTRTHDAAPVPFCMCGAGISVDGIDRYSEKSASQCVPIDGPSFFEMLINRE